MRLAFLLAVAAGGLWLAVTPEAGQGSGASRTDRARTGAPPSGNHRGGYLPPAPKPAGSPQGRTDQGFTPRAPYMKAACELPWRWALETYRGWRPGPSRSTDLITIPSSRNYMGTWYTTSHAGPYGYLQKVPLVFYGPGFVKSVGDFRPSDRVSLADVAPTVAQLLGLGMPTATGSSVSGILKAKATAPPKLVLTVTIDGGGWNVLNRWPDAWPHLKGIMSKGASLQGVRVGSSPSVTPPIHANISTGTWPRRHGVPAIVLRSDGGEVTGAFRDFDNDRVIPLDPNRNLRAPTVGDLWDKAMGNRPKVGLIAAGNYPLGMLGHGAAFPGGDRDFAALLAARGRFTTDRRFYSLPRYVNAGGDPLPRYEDTLDRSDGQADGLWQGHALDELTAAGSPVLGPWETDMVLDILRRERYGRDDITDLFYVHYKSPDHVGHQWNMVSSEMSDVLRSVDEGIGKLVDWLNHSVGRDGYVLLVTADHGQTPLQAGGWPISQNELFQDIESRFDHTEDGRTIIQSSSANVLFTNKAEMKVNGVSPEEISSWLTGYTIADNLAIGSSLAEGYEDRGDELVYSAAFPGRAVTQVAMCTGALGRD
ncbi:hypothetical protein BH20ACT22_BH20ACT22_17590 [soil metagenome]